MRKYLTLFFPAIVLVLGIVFNWIYSYEEILLSRNGVECKVDRRVPYSRVGTNDLLAQTEASIERRRLWASISPTRYYGGFPFTFYAANSIPQGSTIRAFSIRAFLMDILLWGGATAAAVFFARKSRAELEAEDSDVKQLSLREILIATFVIAVALVVVRDVHSNGKRHGEISQRVVELGGVSVTGCYFPSVIANFVPQYLRNAYTRVLQVDLHNPTPEQVDEVASIPGLITLRIGGDNYDLRLLDSLAENIFLSELRISGRRLDGPFVDMLSHSKQLQVLNLNNTNITAQALSHLGEMPDLLAISLADTNVYLEDPQIPPWAHTVRFIDLPTANAGKKAVHRVHGWPKLEELCFISYTFHRNQLPLDVEVHENSELRKLSFDSLQLFDLSLEELPKLQTLALWQFGTRLRKRPADSSPDAIWTREIRLQDLPSLSKVTIHAAQLESISCSGLNEPTLNLQASATESRNVPYFTAPEIKETDIPLEQREQWISHLSASEFTRMDLSYLPLHEVDLSPLAQNPHLRELDLSYCALSPREIDPILGMSNLLQLHLEGVQVDAKKLQAILEAIPDLQVLGISPSPDMQSLRIENKASLKTVFAREREGRTFGGFGYGGLASIYLENLPAFQEELDVSPFCEELHVVDSGLRALRFWGPMCENARLENISGLRVFAAGGKQLSDATVQAVLQSSELEQLVLAHAELQPETIRSIGRLPNLQYLDLTGTQLPDDVLDGWTPSEKLRTLLLGPDSGNVVPTDFLSQLPSLEQLEVAGLDESHLIAICESAEHLKVLRIRDAELTEASLKAIVVLPLYELDLSGCDVSQETLQFIGSNLADLVMLRLNRANVDGRGLLQLANVLPQVQFEIADIRTDERATDQLVADQRASEGGEEGPLGFQLSIMFDEDDAGLPAADFFSPAREEQMQQYYSAQPPGSNLNPPVYSNPFYELGYWLGTLQQVPSTGQDSPEVE